MPVQTIRWIGDLDGWARIIDQTLLPREYKTMDCKTAEEVWEAIKVLRVRGAPAIGIAAAYGVVVGIQDAPDKKEAFFKRLDEVTSYLATSRPTAVNLFWALERMKAAAEKFRGLEVSEIKRKLLAEARAIYREDVDMCRAIGKAGVELVGDEASILTHCNAGGLATSGYGTALAVIFSAAEAGKSVRVYADETRPLLQGARLTAWELVQADIPVTAICDNMAGVLMSRGKVDLVVVGADRIAANGDAANKIGTYSLSVLAKAHNVPFYVAAPSSTFDLALDDGSAIPIEERARDEVAHFGGVQTVPDGADVYNPAFDVTPASNITAIITERGVIHSPTREGILKVIGENQV